MFRTLPEARPLLRAAIQRAVSRTLGDLRDKSVEQEPQITDRLMARIEDEVTDLNIPDARFRAITFTDRGRNSEESRWGADFAGFLTISYTNARVVKVFLGQAKIGKDEGLLSLDGLSARARTGLLEQIDKMLLITPECYLTVYTGSSIKLLPALSIKNTLAQGENPNFWHEIGRYIPNIDAVSFYEQHFERLIGDMTIGNKVDFVIDSSENLKRALELVMVRSGQSILASIGRPLIAAEEQRG